MVVDVIAHSDGLVVDPPVYASSYVRHAINFTKSDTFTIESVIPDNSTVEFFIYAVFHIL